MKSDDGIFLLFDDDGNGLPDRDEMALRRQSDEIGCDSVEAGFEGNFKEAVGI